MISLNSIKLIEVVWVDDGGSWVYRALPTSIKINQNSKWISFTLREVDGQDQNFEVVIKRKNGTSFTFKTDYYEEPEKEYPLRAFTASDALLLYFKGSEGIAHFHLTSAE